MLFMIIWCNLLWFCRWRHSMCTLSNRNSATRQQTRLQLFIKKKLVHYEDEATTEDLEWKKTYLNIYNTQNCVLTLWAIFLEPCSHICIASHQTLCCYAMSFQGKHAIFIPLPFVLVISLTSIFQVNGVICELLFLNIQPSTTDLWK